MQASLYGSKSLLCACTYMRENFQAGLERRGKTCTASASACALVVPRYDAVACGTVIIAGAHAGTGELFACMQCLYYRVSRSLVFLGCARIVCSPSIHF